MSELTSRMQPETAPGVASAVIAAALSTVHTDFLARISFVATN